MFSEMRPSLLFPEVLNGTLKHPTNKNFSPQAWVTALEGVPSPSDRDYSLFLTAIFIYTELDALRSTIHSDLFTLGLEDSLDLVVAVSNFQCVGAWKRIQNLASRRLSNSAGTYLGDTGDVFLKNVGGQELHPDDVIAGIADALPNLLFHISKTGRNADEAARQAALSKGRQLVYFASIERSLRDIWQRVLWEDYSFSSTATGTKFTSTNRELAAYWVSCRKRFETITAQQTNMTLGARAITNETKPLAPILTRTVIAQECRPGKKKGYIVGRAKSNGGPQHAMRDALKATYLAPFIERTTENRRDNISYMDLMKCWWILQDIVRLRTSSMRQVLFSRWKQTVDFMLPVSCRSLKDAFVSALGLSYEQAETAIQTFSVDPRSDASIFTKGLWGRPILRTGMEDKGRLCVATLIAPNPVLTFERWLDSTGFEDDSKSRGSVFEEFTRTSLQKSISNNSVMEKVVIGSLKNSRFFREEIDMIMLIGKSVVVCELKCFSTPFEAQDYYNYLKKIKKAVQQAKRKASWVSQNTEIVLHKLRWQPPENGIKRVLPLVVLNSPYGSGLVQDNCAITDATWLKNLLGSNSITLQGSFYRGLGASLQSKILYSSLDSFEENFTDIVTNHPTAAAEKNRVKWIETPFPTSDGGSFKIEYPLSVGVPTY